MIHFHGCPITPRAKLLELAGRNFCVSMEDSRDLEVVHEIGQSVMLDNGAYTKWSSGRGDVDVGAFAHWVKPWLDYHTTWCVIPDKIDGDAAANDKLLDVWAYFAGVLGLPGGPSAAPVWHMHESIDRLETLCSNYQRVCIGSSGEYASVGDDRWRRRMYEAMNELCGDGPPPVWLHMLRGMKLAGDEFPFASVDSTNIANNHAGNNTRSTPAKDPRKMADYIDARQCPSTWTVRELQEGLFA